MNKVFYKNAQTMNELADESIDFILTSPPYFNIKSYGGGAEGQLGDINNYDEFINELLKVWVECERVLKPNGKLAINVPMLPMIKKDLSTHYNRHIFDLNADIQHSILKATSLFLYDLYIWNRTNSSKPLMFGSYPYPRNFYLQNTSDFIGIYVKDGKPDTSNITQENKEKSKLTQKEWVEYTKHIWDIPIELQGKQHPAIMTTEIARRCIKLFSFVGDVVLDPFAGSGTTLKVARDLGRDYVGYEVETYYKRIIEDKLAQGQLV